MIVLSPAKFRSAAVFLNSHYASCAADLKACQRKFFQN